MKTIKLIFALSMIVAFQITHSSCGKQKRNQYVTYEGYVYYKSGAPAANVSVVLEACAGGPGDRQEQCTGNKFTIKKTQTDYNGYFYIHEKAARTDIYFSTIDKYYSNNSGVSAGTLKEDRFSNVHLAH